MRVARNHDLAVLCREVHERSLQLLNFTPQSCDLISQPEPHVERDLVVARASGMKLGPSGNAPGQFRFDVHVNILKLWFPGELAGGDFRSDLLQASLDFVQLSAADQPDLLEHRGMSDRAADIVLPQSPIE